jgi:hypothetical protein
MMYRKVRDFRSILQELQVVDKPEKSVLDWKPVSYESARLKYKFKIFSRRFGAIAKYRIGTIPPNILWTEISGVPDGAGFEEAKDKECAYVRMTKFGIEERGARIKITRRT